MLASASSLLELRFTINTIWMGCLILGLVNCIWSLREFLLDLSSWESQTRIQTDRASGMIWPTRTFVMFCSSFPPLTHPSAKHQRQLVLRWGRGDHGEMHPFILTLKITSLVKFWSFNWVGCCREVYSGHWFHFFLLSGPKRWTRRDYRCKYTGVMSQCCTKTLCSKHMTKQALLSTLGLFNYIIFFYIFFFLGGVFKCPTLCTFTSITTTYTIHIKNTYSTLDSSLLTSPNTSKVSIHLLLYFILMDYPPFFLSFKHKWSLEGLMRS